MTIHWLDARKLADELAAGAVDARAQATYIALSFVVGFAPYYLLIVPAASTDSPTWYWGMWSYEAVTVVAAHVAGVFHCLARSRVRPDQTFAIDFSCLYAPIGLTTTVAGWAAFYLVMRGILGVVWYVVPHDVDSDLLRVAFSPRLWDVVRYVALFGIVVVIYYRIGRHLERISALRA